MMRRWVLVIVLVGCGGPGDDGDGGARCADVADCDDGLFCNGAEACDPSSPAASPRGCVPGTPPCDGEREQCDESMDRCQRRCDGTEELDADGDGFTSDGCIGGTDCDDTDPAVNPLAIEICDALGRDEDCNPATVGGPTSGDADGDGFFSSRCINGDPAGTPTRGEDCDDARVTVHPDAPEECDHRDQDCDGLVDEGVAVTGFLDRDADGDGDPEAPARGCEGDPRFATVGTDCDDGDLSVRAGAAEICDLLDNDCDGIADESPRAVAWYPDADGDLFGDVAAAEIVVSCAPVEGYSLRASDCDDGAAGIHPAAMERCNGVDDDCNGLLDGAAPGGEPEDADRDGVPNAACMAMLADLADRDFFACGVPEVCMDGVDNDCDGAIDEASTEPVVWYVDVDGDGWGDEGGASAMGCTSMRGMSLRTGDCDDSSPDLHPFAPDRCNGRDDDCDGAIDENAERRVGSDPRHCGACGAGCGAAGACTGGSCSSTVIDVVVGNSATCALRDTGRVVCWGRSLPMPLSASDSPVPLDANLLSDAAGAPLDDVDRIYANTSGIDIAGSTYCAHRRAPVDQWLCYRNPPDRDGALGVGTFANAPRVAEPLVYGPSDGLALFTHGADFGCAIVGAGRLECWGRNQYGQLGRGFVSSPSADPLASPAAVMGLGSGVTHVGAGQHHACAVRSGEVWCWGWNGHGEVDGAIGADVDTPVRVALPAGAAVIQVAPSRLSTCVLRADGEIVCWGQRFGPPSMISLGTIAGAAELETFGEADTWCARTSAGAVWCMGAGSWGELGRGDLVSDFASFQEVAGGHTFTSVAVGADTLCALEATGAVWCWGDNTYGECGVGTSYARQTTPRRTCNLPDTYACY